MDACLNPVQRHPESQPAPGRLLCAEPGCGFFVEGATIERWQIKTLLGQAPAADLYLATEPAGPAAPGSRMLVKVLRPTPAGLPGQVERELGQLVALRHPHIHPLQRAGWTSPGGRCYLLSPFVEQGSFFHYPGSPTRLPPLAVATIVRQIAEALQYAHDQHVVHGRLKPENCLLVALATVQVSDFYRALLTDEQPASSSDYAAPEQAYGSAEPASDQYALAIIAYQLLQGQLPILGPDPVGALVHRIRSSPPPLTALSPDLPRPVEQTLRRALSVSPRERFSAVLDFAVALQGALEVARAPGSAFSPEASARSFQTPPPVPRAPDSTKLPPHGVLPLCLLPGHTAPCAVLQWAPDGSHLASAGPDQVVRLWRILQRIGAPVAALAGHTAEVLALSWSPDGGLLASAAADATIRIWSLAGRPGQGPGQQAAWWGHDGSVTALVWSPDGRRIATGGTDRTIRLWDVSGQAIGAWPAHSRGGVTALAWSPDGSLLASGGPDRQLHLWSSATGEDLVAMGLADEIGRLTWSPDGTLLAVAGGKRDPSVVLLDGHTGQRLGALTGHTREVVGLFWDRGAAWLATASADATLRVWDTHLRFGQPIGFPVQLQSAPFAMAGSSNSRLVALSLADMLIQVVQLMS
jgi:WD40 repeat protein